MISVGIAAYNEEKNIENTLRKWLDEPINEIIVISDSSTDKTNEIIKRISKKDKRVRLIEREKREGKPSAINEILKRVKGQIIIMTDADLHPKKGSTNYLLKHFKDKKVGLVAGHPILIDAKGMVGYWSKISFDIMHKKRLKNIELDVTGNLYAIRKGIVKKIPTEVMIEDTYVALMAKKKGYDIVYEPNAQVYVDHPKTIRDFIVQKTRTRTGWYQITKDENVKTGRSVTAGIKDYFPMTIKNLFTLKGIMYLPLFYIMSFYVWIMAWLNWKSKRKVLDVWKIAESSK